MTSRLALAVILFAVSAGLAYAGEEPSPVPEASMMALWVVGGVSALGFTAYRRWR
jgi:hypothetical protein